MKKLFTLVALLAVFLGAKAQQEWEEVYKIDYSTYQGFPFYVMGYVPEFDNGCMTDFGAMYKYVEAKEDAEETSSVIVTTAGGVEYYKIELTEPGWHQYFIADNIRTEIDGTYRVKALVKASEACTINVNMGWGWGNGESTGTSVSIPEGNDFQEVEWEYTGIGGTSCNLVAQPGTVTATIEWKSLVVEHKLKQGGRPQVWLEALTNGDAETPWGDLANVKFNDQENNFKICAWAKEKGNNLNADGGSDPYPASIEVDPDDPTNHVFVCHGNEATTEGDAAAWDNQFWIQSNQPWKSGTKLKIKFRYKCSKESVKTNTQVHKQNPSDYLIWHAIGDITFTDQWQTFDDVMTMGDDMANGWSIAFNLNANDKDAIDFYFDDLSWQYLQLDKGFFVSGINTETAKSYENLDNAIQFVLDDPEDDECLTYVATIGKEGDKASYVSQVMISTVRGDDAAFKGATLKVDGTIHNDEEEWLSYTESTNAKLDLPGLGVWKVWIDTEFNAMAFKLIEGEEFEEPDPVAIVTNAAELIVNALERQPTATEQPADPDAGIEAGTGQPWDNQFFIKANRVLKTGEKTIIEFDYVASQEAKSTTQCHALPGDYRGGGMGDVNFTTEEQHFKGEFEVPSHDKADIQTMVFNLAEIKDACQYTFKNIKWYLKDDTLNENGQTKENLINAEGNDNFSWVVVGGTGIENVTKNAKSSNVTYNLAGQRVSKDFKGIVIKNGQKFMSK